MKKTTLIALLLGLTIMTHAQEPAPAVKGATYGAGASAEAAVPASQLEQNMKDGKFTGTATGKVLSVCQEKGCWMKVEKANGETMMVKFKDYGFFMPKDIVGKQVALDGEATVKETSVKQLKHYAGDAGKSQEEINKITAPKKELIFTAKGVRVL